MGPGRVFAVGKEFVIEGLVCEIELFVQGLGQTGS